jgi:hypothetical protein
MGHNKSSVKRKSHAIKCLHKGIGDISYWQFKSARESSRTIRTEYTQEEQTAGNNQTQG